MQGQVYPSAQHNKKILSQSTQYNYALTLQSTFQRNPLCGLRKLKHYSLATGKDLEVVSSMEKKNMTISLKTVMMLNDDQINYRPMVFNYSEMSIFFSVRSPIILPTNQTPHPKTILALL
jgi:hypothetical protein